MRRSVVLTFTSAAALAATTAVLPSVADAVTPTGAHPARTTTTSGAQDYIVLYSSPSAAKAARAAITAAGGTVVSENGEVGYAVARSSDAAFASRVSGSGAVVGAARDRVIGYAPTEKRASAAAQQRTKASDLERLTEVRSQKRPAGQKDAAAVPDAEPLANRQWDMRQIGATPNGSYRVQPGSKGVRVGIIDTGIDGSHPDVAANFDAALSHNFVTDNPAIDGPCEHPSCVDPVDEDDNEHGTHVASTIGAPINGIGIAGVAPNVTLLNLRAGQDSGYFFLQPTLEAITYAADIGVDVINMSFYVDPWLFNCVDNPADSPAERTEQRVIRETTQRALDYARRHGVLPIAAMGNEFTDLGHPVEDTTSPDFPAGAAKTRQIDNSCITVPTESKGVVSVSSIGPSTRLAYYSNYGTEQTDVSAPGGDAYDSPDGTVDPRSMILAAYPENVARANGDIDENGEPTNDFVVRDCKGDICAYYQYLQGTSMASPHAVGVAALIVSEYGKKDHKHGGLTLDPSTTERILERTAVDHACPQPRDYVWTLVTRSGAVVSQSATCKGSIRDNGFYGNGVVNAYAAVTARG
ncbi:MAG TPA: S8 family serine peptidase [Actinomycetales bacterium]|nr:S8 family serine peptidase [Actinomycetales bacterium]